MGAEPLIDTTAAGDGFAGGYLVGRLSGRPPNAAIRLGVAVAAQVNRWPGAIVPDNAFVPSLP